MMQKERYLYVDLVKALAIFLMVFCHTGITSPINVWVYAFHMPVFFILSGLFINPNKYGIYEFVEKRIKQILVPYFLFALIYCFGHESLKDWTYILYASRDSLVIAKSFSPLWFLPCLFVSNVLFFILARYISRLDVLGMVSLSISCLGFILPKNLAGMGMPFSVNVALVSVIFVYSGYILNRISLKWNALAWGGGNSCFFGVGLF